MPHDVRSVTELVHERLFDADLHVEYVLTECHITDAMFSARFRHTHHIYLRKYIEQLRIEAAKMLLHHKELDALLIAFFIGYNRYRTFARAFKRLVKCSPSAFRAK